MDKAARVRWFVLVVALGTTVAAIFYPTEERDDEVVLVESRPPVEAKPARAGNSPASPATSTVDWVASSEDPFAPRHWEAPAPEPEPARTVQAVVVEAAALPPPPPLPYAFVGQMSDAGTRVIYLSRGEQLLLARAGETLEGTYKVVTIGASHIEFETVGSGLRQSLTIPAQDRQ